MPSINPQRLLDDLQSLREFGESGAGVVRMAFSDADMRSRDWLCQEFRKAGLNASIDGVGNVLGISRNSGPAVLIGSHSDTQPEGGWLDGAYGVICALEVARAFSEDPNTSDLAIDVASWMDEEGTYLGSLGSLSFCERLTSEELSSAESGEGKKLVDVLESLGLADIRPATLQPQRHRAYLEAHIEQGPVLDANDQTIGVVTEIVGVRDITIIFSGQQNHAGTTPMKMRHDAASSLITAAAAINEHFPEQAGPHTVWTMGSIKLATNSPSTIPGRAELRLQIRDPETEVLDRLENLAASLTDHLNGQFGVDICFTVDERIAPAKMDEIYREHIAQAATDHAAGKWRHLPSGAAHDAQILATRVPSAMVFVPSIGGISHSFDEDTAEADLVTGCKVLCDAAFAIHREFNNV